MERVKYPVYSLYTVRASDCMPLASPIVRTKQKRDLESRYLLMEWMIYMRFASFITPTVYPPIVIVV